MNKANNPELGSQLINQYMKLKEESILLKDQMEAIKIALFELYPTGGNVEGHRLTLTKGRVNWAKLADKYNPETNPELYSLQFDSKKAEQQLPPALLDEYRAKSSQTIR